MGKNKGKSKNRSRPRREFGLQGNGSFAPVGVGANAVESPNNQSSSSFPLLENNRLNPSGSNHSGVNHSNSGINLSAYIDHRMHDDLAHIHSSPARSRRRNSLQNFHSLNQGQTAMHNTNHQIPKAFNTDSNIPRNKRSAVSSSNVGNNSARQAIYEKRASLPLTNQNLQGLLSQSNGNDLPYRYNSNRAERSAYGSVLLDMDQYTKEQRNLASNQTWNEPFHDGQSYNGSNEDLLSINSLEFGGSNPSSDHSSDSTSLDDVCFPDYYDHEMDSEGNKQSNYRWPDLQVMQEFVNQELEEYGDDHNESNDEGDQQNVNFHYPLAHTVHSGSNDEPRSPFLRDESHSPSLLANEQDYVSREDTPLLNNTQVNEVESLETTNNSFRIRPQPIQPWEKSKEHVQTILSNSQYQTPNQHKHQHADKSPQKPQVDSSLCRFTYFREDLQKTIHSPTISGLLAKDGSNKFQDGSVSLQKKWGDGLNAQNDDILEETNLTLKDLFMPSFYSQKNGFSSASESVKDGTPVPIPASDLNDTAQAADSSNPLGEASTSFNNNNVSSNRINSLTGLNNASRVSNQKQGTAMENKNISLAAPGVPGTATATGSLVASNSNDINVNPFWLDVLDPTEEEMKVLSKTFGIHPLTTEDIFLGEAREKVELFKSYYFICFTSFDIVYERRKQRAKEQEKKFNKLQEMYDRLDNSGASGHESVFGGNERKSKIWSTFSRLLWKSRDNYKSNVSHDYHGSSNNRSKSSSSTRTKTKKIREGELSPLNMYMIVFRDAVITFHFSATPHPINVRRRARLLKDYLTVSSDWICYALIDDITDSFAPMIESIEEEVNQIEDAILKMHSGDTDSEDESDSEEEESDDEYQEKRNKVRHNSDHIFYRRKRSKSTVDGNFNTPRLGKPGRSGSSVTSRKSKKSSKSSSTKSTSSKILGWKRKGDMLRRIGECRKRVMSVLRLLGSKADVIKGFSKRFSEQLEATTLWNSNGAYINRSSNGLQPKSDIGMYLGDIQDHIVTMVQSLNHYEKLLARFHSNYLAQINIDMTKVNNDTNDVLGKITILGTIVLPINVVTGLWGMNCIVPGQDYEGLAWFFSIVFCMFLFSVFAYYYAKRVYGL